MAQCYQTSSSVYSVADEAGYGLHAHAACVNPASCGGRAASPSALAYQQPCNTDLLAATGMVSTGFGPICINTPSVDTALMKMAQKLFVVATSPQEENQPPHFGNMLGGSVPPPLMQHASIPAHQRSWRAQEAQERVIDIGRLLKQGHSQSKTGTRSGETTAANTVESLPSLASDDDDNIAFTTQKFNFGEKAKQGWGGMTTLMVRNVPVMYTQQLLLKEWKNDGAYDFLYLPRNPDGQTNLSYAFINFVSEAHAMAFKARWHKKRMARFTARKPLNVGFANMQGLKANILQVTGKHAASIDAPQNLPYIVVNGQQVEPGEALAKLAYEAGSGRRR